MLNLENNGTSGSIYGNSSISDDYRPEVRSSSYIYPLNDQTSTYFYPTSNTVVSNNNGLQPPVNQSRYDSTPVGVNRISLHKREATSVVVNNKKSIFFVN